MAVSAKTSFTRRSESLAERAAKCTEEQRRLKESAAASRAKAAAAPAVKPSAKRDLKRS